MNIPDNVIEYLASEVHNVWMNWSQSVAGSVSENRLKRWKKLWVPYWDLPGDEKKSDRKIAEALLEKVYPLLRNKIKAECWYCDAPLGSGMSGGFCSFACREKARKMMFKGEMKLLKPRGPKKK